MRRLMTLAAAIALTATAFLATPSQAMPLGDPAGVRSAATTINPVDHVAACWRYGWHSWGWYPCYYYYGYGPYYGGYPRWGGGWGRGWGGGWGWRGGGHWRH